MAIPLKRPVERQCNSAGRLRPVCSIPAFQGRDRPHYGATYGGGVGSGVPWPIV